MIEKNNWYSQNIQQVCDTFQVDPDIGLSESEINRRRLVHGPNELIDRGLKSPWLILWEQLTAVMVVILIIAALVSAVLGDYKDAIAIVAIVILNAVLGFICKSTGLKKPWLPLKKWPFQSLRCDGRGACRKFQPAS